MPSGVQALIRPPTRGVPAATQFQHSSVSIAAEKQQQQQLTSGSVLTRYKAVQVSSPVTCAVSSLVIILTSRLLLMNSMITMTLSLLSGSSQSAHPQYAGALHLCMHTLLVQAHPSGAAAVESAAVPEHMTCKLMPSPLALCKATENAAELQGRNDCRIVADGTAKLDSRMASPSIRSCSQARMNEHTVHVTRSLYASFQGGACCHLTCQKR